MRPLRGGWIVGGDLAQCTGGYVYDRLVIEGLRSRGHTIDVVDPKEFENAPAAGKAGSWDVVVGDALWVREIGRGFARAARAAARVLLVHHLASWEVERSDRGAMRAVEGRAIAASDHLVATSEATRSRLGLEHPGRAVDVVVPGADRLPCLARLPRNDSLVQLIFVGNVIPRKRVPMLLDALERLADPRLILTLVGDRGRDPLHAREVAARIDGSKVLQASVTTVGPLDDHALAQAMARADALVLPSSLEGFGMVIAEAIHAGLAVFAARDAARAAGIGDEPAALVFDDGPGLTDAIRRFAEHPSRRAAMHRAAERTTLWRWADAIASFEQVLTRAMASERARVPDRVPGP